MRNLTAIIFTCILLGSGCTPLLEMQTRTIALGVSMDEISEDNNLITKAEEDMATAKPFTGTPSAGNKLEAALWFSNDLGEYSHAPQAPTFLPCSTSISYSSMNPSDIRTGNGELLQYPIAEGSAAPNVYCVGFYPSTGWGELTETPVTSAAHTINGSEDLMFAEQISGSYSENFPRQTYGHVLTWVKINMSATSLKAANVWGAVESLKIESPKDGVMITFPTAEGQSSTIEYTGSPKTFMVALPDDDKGLKITTRTFGQVFCAPPAKDSEDRFGYTIKVKTANLPEKEVFVVLKKEDNITLIENAEYAIGKLFVINLRFNDIAIVEGVCTLKQWDDQSSDIYFNDTI